MIISKTTNVKPADLNYDRYTRNQYDRDIVSAIPFHKEIHAQIADYIFARFPADKPLQVADLGAGTGITSAVIKSILPRAHFDIVDFSRQMLNGAREKMGTRNTRYILADYASIKFNKKYDIIITVIGLHHQTTKGAKALIKKVYRNLNKGRVFILSDLVTHADKNKAARCNALHYKHLADHAANEKVLTEWAYHHMFLNDLKTMEDYLRWISQAGFKIDWRFDKLNTALIIGKKLSIDQP